MAQRNNDYRNTYIEGNTVRRNQAVPGHAVPKRGPEVPQRSREEIIRDRQRRLAAKRNQQRAMAMNRGYVFFLSLATLICCGVCALFIHLQSNITTRMSDIAELETQISEKKADNDAAENRLETTMTLEEIKAKAAGLGLVYPSSEQIQHYSVESSDYMNQY